MYKVKNKIIQILTLITLLGMCAILSNKQYCETHNGNGLIYWSSDELDEMINFLNEEALKAGITFSDGVNIYYPDGRVEPVGGGSSQQTTETPATQTQPEKQKVKSCDHTYTAEEIKEATCIEPGEMKFTCKNCGDTYTQESEPTGEHKYSSEITKEATCTEAGEETYTCDACGDTYTEEIKAIGHNYSDKITKSATCTEEGVRTFACENCGDTYTEAVEALGHTPDEGLVTKKAGLFFNGEKVIHCTTCNEVVETQVLESTYPIYYLYIICGVVGLLVAVGIVLGVLKAKRRI